MLPPNSARPMNARAKFPLKTALKRSYRLATAMTSTADELDLTKTEPSGCTSFYCTKSFTYLH
jgi:hypothetical protein